MSQVREQENMSGGEVQFTPAVGFREVVEFGQMLKEGRFGHDGSRFALQVRKRDDRYVLMLRYELGAEESSARFYEEFIKLLRNHFGPDCRGWSISSPIWQIE